ncbi:MBL fold metallo-hydrolase [Paenibacillus tengchongensis]|uniref:MBL fold metallo-hydrolase n=1 Tax=Paenibacillus tengchongensis TaxID=2608684 RepID=UPI00124F4217|nr:MBL fold metallo-hydrolase [Paenibacillus tengchongensis]
MEHRFEQLTPHILLMHAEHDTDRPVLAAIGGRQRTLLMDGGNSPSHARLFQKELAGRGLRQPDLMALTHWHWDHSFGIAAWNVPVLAHREAADTLAGLAGLDWSDECLQRLVEAQTISEASAEHIRLEYGDKRDIRILPPDIVFTGRLTVQLGGVTCELVHVDSDHSPDSCILYVREDRTLFLGDALGPAVYGGPRRYNGARFLRLLETVYGYDADWFVESHGVPMSRSEFMADLAPWAQLARLAGSCGSDRQAIIAGMKTYLDVEELPADLLAGVEEFIAGAGD